MTLEEFLPSALLKSEQFVDSDDADRDANFALYAQEAAALLARKTAIPILDGVHTYRVTPDDTSGKIVLQTPFLRTTPAPVLRHRSERFVAATDITATAVATVLERDFVAFSKPTDGWPEGEFEVQVSRGLAEDTDAEIVGILRSAGYAYVADRFNGEKPPDLNKRLDSILRPLYRAALYTGPE